MHPKYWTPWVLLAGLSFTAVVAVGQQGRRVDDAALRNAGQTGDEWIAYGRTQQETRFSPLNQIDTANVRRLEQLESFKHIYAPFSGVITKRLVDIGALINAGNGGMNQELFDLARIDPIRVYIDVPEIYAPFVHYGVKGSIELASIPGEKFIGEVARSADAIDPTTRTLRTEIDVPNSKGQLFPGGFAQVHFAVNVTTPRLSVPVNALLFRADGNRAAVVDSDGKVHLQPVVIGRDYGTEVEILSGLQANDSLVLNPPDSLEEGEQVQVNAPSGGHS